MHADAHNPAATSITTLPANFIVAPPGPPYTPRPSREPLRFFDGRALCCETHMTHDPQVHTRRPRYPGRNPRAFQDKYKELNPERYAPEIQKILASGRTPAGTHRPIMVEETLRCLRPEAGDVAVDCTLGSGGHAQAILE